MVIGGDGASRDPQAELPGWEYRLEVIGGPIHSWRRESMEVLAPLGARGWEVVGIVPWLPDAAPGRQRMGAEYLVLLKRPLPAA